MKKFILILFITSIHFGFAQKKYSFNLYTVYELTNSNSNNYLYITFSDSIKNNYKLTFFSKNDTIRSVSLFDFELLNSYDFEINNIKFESIDFANDFKNYSKKTGNYHKGYFNEICKRFKHYERNIEKSNDSIEIEIFKFYKEKRKKNIKAIVTIENFTNKYTNNIVPSDFIGIINKCINTSYQSKIINKINTIYFHEDGSKYEEQLKLIEINTTNFSVNIQE